MSGLHFPEGHPSVSDASIVTTRSALACAHVEHVAASWCTAGAQWRVLIAPPPRGPWLPSSLQPPTGRRRAIPAPCGLPRAPRGPLLLLPPCCIVSDVPPASLARLSMHGCAAPAWMAKHLLPRVRRPELVLGLVGPCLVFGLCLSLALSRESCWRHAPVLPWHLCRRHRARAALRGRPLVSHVGDMRSCWPRTDAVGIVRGPPACPASCCASC